MFPRTARPFGRLAKSKRMHWEMTRENQFISGTIQAQTAQNEQLSQLMKASGMTASDLYDAKFTGKQYVFAWQLDASYRFHEVFYAFLGMRINYAYNSYEGSMKSRVDNEILN